MRKSKKKTVPKRVIQAGHRFADHILRNLLPFYGVRADLPLRLAVISSEALLVVQGTVIDEGVTVTLLNALQGSLPARASAPPSGEHLRITHFHQEFLMTWALMRRDCRPDVTAHKRPWEEFVNLVVDVENEEIGILPLSRETYEYARTLGEQVEEGEDFVLLRLQSKPSLRLVLLRYPLQYEARADA